MDPSCKKKVDLPVQAHFASLSFVFDGNRIDGIHFILCMCGCKTPLGFLFCWFVLPGVAPIGATPGLVFGL